MHLRSSRYFQQSIGETLDFFFLLALLGSYEISSASESHCPSTTVPVLFFPPLKSYQRDVSDGCVMRRSPILSFHGLCLGLI